MCHQVSVELPPEPRSARTAREFVAEHCLQWKLDVICLDVTLPVSELVTNTVLHARTTATVTVSLTHEFLEVSVRDASPRRPIVRPVRMDLKADIDVLAGRPDALPDDPHDPALRVGEAGTVTAGRGLLIVDAVADEWGTADLRGGKDVWFRVRTPQDWQPRLPCQCAGSATTTPGGLPMHLS